jgi:hypothetical protein
MHVGIGGFNLYVPTQAYSMSWRVVLSPPPHKLLLADACLIATVVANLSRHVCLP